MDNKIYTWIDVQDKLIAHFNQEENEAWLENISFQAYWDGLHIEFAIPKTKGDILQKLEAVFLSRFSQQNHEATIEMEADRHLPIFFEEVESQDIKKSYLKPFLGRNTILKKMQPFLYNIEEGQSPAFLAFHSFKGGVGRTLHAIALALRLSEQAKVLLIDADFEAPGISWLIDKTPISFADFLAMLHGNKNHERVINETAQILTKEKYEKDNLYILPAFRGLKNGGMPSLEIKPEHIFKFSENPFILTEVLRQLARKMGVDYVILDLRAGVSELSSSWFLDPTIHKVFVTTLSSQSMLGTAKMFDVLANFENKYNTKAKNEHFLIVSQVAETAIKSLQNEWKYNLIEGELAPLRKKFISAFLTPELEENNELLNDELESIAFFSEEKDGFKTLPAQWEKVVARIRENKLDKELTKILSGVDIVVNTTQQNIDFEKVRKDLKEITRDLIVAETSKKENFLQTKAISNLMNNFEHELPVAVVIGAKGAGKTYLYKQLWYAKTWQAFSNNTDAENAWILPVTVPRSINPKDNFHILPTEIQQITEASEKDNIWQNYIKPDIEKSLTLDNLTKTDWRNKWLDYIAWAAGFQVGKAGVSQEFMALLKLKKQKIVTTFDGLEELFEEFSTNEKQKVAISALLQDVTSLLETQTDKHLGSIIFVRKDIVLYSAGQNITQFISKYQDYELIWDRESSLRLVHWVLNEFKILVTVANWKEELQEMNFNELSSSLQILWGRKLGGEKSNEAFSHTWVLDSLSNLKGEIQSRDMIRFLAYTAEDSLKANTTTKDSYKDRILFPIQIRGAIKQVGEKKLEEVKEENKPLKIVLEILEKDNTSLRLPCEKKDLERVLIETSYIKTLEDNGFIILHQNEYHMASIYQQALNIARSRAGKPLTKF